MAAELAGKIQNLQRVVTQILPATFLGIAAFALVLAGTEPLGPGLDPDAVSYLGAAESLAHSGSYRIPTAEWASPDTTEPLAHFPPGYPTALAIPIALGATPIQGARFIQAIAAFITTFTVVLLVTGATNIITAVFLALALFAMTAMHEVHISVLSEPVYLACMMLTLAAMVRWPEHPLRAGIPAAIAAMTRYAGISLVGAVALWALTGVGSWKQRIIRACVAVAPAAVLQLLWVLRTGRAHDAEEIRTFAVYGEVGTTLTQGLATLVSWLVPDPTGAPDMRYRGIIACAIGLVLIALVYMGYTWLRWEENCRARTGNSPVPRVGTMALRLLRACALVLVCYLGLVLASRVFADPLIPLDERIMSPALLLLMIVLAVTISTWWRRTRRVITRLAVAVALILWWLAAAGATRLESSYALEWGSDFAGQQWRASQLIAWARKHAGQAPLYTNWPAAVFFYLHRTSHELPKHADATTLAALGDTLRARKAIVLLFDAPNGEYISNDMMYDVPGLVTLIELRDGVVLRSAGKP